MGRLIITNGDVAAERLTAAGIDGEILVWADILHEGPVPAGLPLEELSAIRAGFIAEHLGFDRDDVHARFAARDRTLRRHGDYDRVELWFEHDLYDQLQLIQLLDFFAAEDRREGLMLVQAGDYLGLQDAAAIRGLAASARPVGPEELVHGRQAWHAFTADSPQVLAQISRQSGGALPFLVPALRRLLSEYPAPGSGLSLTEHRILAALAAGPLSVGPLFKRVSEQEKARFLSDASFFRKLDALAFCEAPLIAGLPFPSPRCAGGPEKPDYRDYAASELTIIAAGTAALAGRFDHAVENGIDRWIGGAHLTIGNLWRWDGEREALFAPA